jgi:hypothetical protein
MASKKVSFEVNAKFHANIIQLYKVYCKEHPELNTTFEDFCRRMMAVGIEAESNSR